MTNLFVAGIKINRDFWAYAVGYSKASAVINAIHDHPRAFLSAIDGYESIDLIEVESHYGRHLDDVLRNGCLYVPKERIIGDIMHFKPEKIRRLLEG